MIKSLSRILFAAFAVGLLAGCDEFEDNSQRHRHHHHRDDDGGGYYNPPPPPPESRDDGYDRPRRRHRDDDDSSVDYPSDNGERSRVYRDNGGGY